MNRAFFLSSQTCEALRPKSFFFLFFKNHSLNFSISHNFKQLVFFFILQQCHKFSVMALKSKKVLNMCGVSCIVSMQFVFPFLVFFVLLFAGTFNAEPLLVLGRGCEDPNTCPEDKKRNAVRVSECRAC